MTTNFDESIIGIWFLPLNKKSDYLCSLVKQEKNYKMVIRFRYYNEDKTKPDKKNWYEVELNKTEDECIEECRKIGTELEMKVEDSGILDELLKGDMILEQFQEEFVNKSYVKSTERDNK